MPTLLGLLGHINTIIAIKIPTRVLWCFLAFTTVCHACPGFYGCCTSMSVACLTNPIPLLAISSPSIVEHVKESHCCQTSDVMKLRTLVVYISVYIVYMPRCTALIRICYACKSAKCQIHF